VRRLRGGISSGMHLVELVAADGARRPLVLRRYNAHRQQADPTACLREWRLLSLLHPAGLPVPEPVLLDAEGRIFGGPAIVLSRLSGHGLLAPRDLTTYLQRLAETLAELHAASPPAAALDFLTRQQDAIERWLVRGPSETQRAGHPRSEAVWDALRAWWPRLQRAAPALIHGDFWPGNTLWRRGRMTGVVDWEQPRLGDPAQDVGCCRLDLTLLFGPEAADAFLHAYEAASGRPLPQITFWDLYMVSWALPDPAGLLPGYHDLGRTELTPEIARARMDGFIARALAGAKSAAAAAGQRRRSGATRAAAASGSSWTAP
jgi:aminoglycoside phosphotransferase (APT) family kinase protein